MKLTVIKNRIEREVNYIGNPTLLEVLEAADYMIPHPCRGNGVCAKCKVFVNGSLELSCQYRLTEADDGARIEIPDEIEMKEIEMSGHGDVVFVDPMPGEVGTAIDIGTTTVAIRNYDLINGRLINEVGFMNPQGAVASDVMGRMTYALESPENLETLQAQICEAIENALEESEVDPDSMVITGNTTMLYLLAGMNPVSLSRAPFEADCLFDAKLNFGPTIAYLPPCMHAFVGADISCAVMASGMCETDDIGLLADIGTNGELALWKNGKLYVTSTAAGPAFEIAGMEGSDIIDKIADELNRDELEMNADVASVQLAKAAIAAGIETLLAETGTAFEDVSTLYIAGGFGSHLNIESGIRIGLIDARFRGKTKVIGNVSLVGASQLLGDMEKIDAIRAIASKAEHVNLGGNPMFDDLYVENMMFPEEE